MKVYYAIKDLATGKYLAPMETELFDRDIIGAGKWPTKESAIDWISNTHNVYIEIVEIYHSYKSL